MYTVLLRGDVGSVIVCGWQRESRLGTCLSYIGVPLGEKDLIARSCRIMDGMSCLGVSLVSLRNFGCKNEISVKGS